MWFDFYTKRRIRWPYIEEDRQTLGDIIYETYFDKEEYDYWQKWESKAVENRGKYVKFYDDVTNEELSAAEIRRMEEQADAGHPYVYIITEEEPGRGRPKKSTSTRKYKPRIPISKDLRMAVYQLYDKSCHKCGSKNANQIHHIDKDPSNNHIKNLELLCYECHLLADGKRMLREIE